MESELNEDQDRADLIAQMKPALIELCREYTAGHMTAAEFSEIGDEALSLYDGGYRGLQGSLHALNALKKLGFFDMGSLISLSNAIWLNHGHPDDRQLQLETLEEFKSAGSISGLTCVHLRSLCRGTTGLPSFHLVKCVSSCHLRLRMILNLFGCHSIKAQANCGAILCNCTK